MKALRARAVCAMMVALVCATAATAQDLASFEKRTTMKKLANGLTVIIVERPEAPVFSYFTHVNVGSVQEVPGITGLAHMFEHMAFKGTDRIGTTDWPAEEKALQKVEEAYAAYDRERRRPTGRDEARIAERKKAFDAAVEEANKFVKTDEFSEIIDREGGVGTNAFTNTDETGYFFSMPSNRFELWAYLESERYVKPIMREFYKERDVVQEERRMRTDSQPIGRLVEQFIATAFVAHPYQRPVVGWMSDLQSFSATDALEFHRKYYVPANMVVTVVGDVKAAEAMPIMEKYFGRLPKGPEPSPTRTVEPQQNAERTVVLREQSQPFYVEGYHRPSVLDADNAVYDAISDLMSNGRTSRLYRALVRDKKIAAQAAGFNGFPGDKYPHLFVLFAVPTPGHTPEQMRDAIREEVERLKKEDVTDEELRMVKTRAKASLIRGLASNTGLALQIGTAQARFGDWRELFRQVDKIEKVTKEDIKRVANKTFVPTNRTVGILENVQAAAQTGGAK
jgi:predicted Zn-dependent peptidase